MKLGAVAALLGLVNSIDTYSGGPTFDIAFEKSSALFKFTVKDLKANTYLAIGFGDGMKNVDMV